MLKPNNVTTRFDSVHLNREGPGGFVDVTLWLNHDRDVIAFAEVRMWFSRDDVDVTTIRKAAIRQAQEICGQISGLSTSAEVPDVPDNFWCAS